MVLRVSVRNVEQLVAVLSSSYSLPLISGGQATWVLDASEPVAVFAQQWSEPRLVKPSELQLPQTQCLAVHFRYLVQADPVSVYERLTE